MTTRTIKVGALARVEGEGALKVTIRDGKVKHAELNIFEPPRFFEGFMQGRAFTEAPDITARICGICPVAYQMSAVHAMEAAIGVEITPEIRALRRLLYCGEWIESHGLHVYMLHAPDFLGYPGAIELANDEPEIVKRGLAMKKAGNQTVATVGGREIHPVNIKVGGFYKAPSKEVLNGLAEKLKEGRDIALETVRWVAGFDFPDVERDYEFVSLSHPHEYPFNEGRIVSNRGLDIDATAYHDHFEEFHMPQSTALHSRIKGRGFYFCGPMARYNLNFSKLPAVAKEIAKEVGLGPACNNPYQSIIIRSIELVFAFDEALRIINDYDEPAMPAVPAVPRAGVGHAATEAPRGMLYHRYQLAVDGSIEQATIIPPTSQNQATIEEDLTTFIPQWLDMNNDDLRWRCEQTVRNYDPCISCATHFLKLDIDRG
ncbi:MAG: Ni/Fe hydrogenase subunit alpha [Alphaproteobacteria bacterium]|nr:Ni/Fe hydrogenase subunit alpha [Alphaproteobacteria bacterium]